MDATLVAQLLYVIIAAIPFTLFCRVLWYLGSWLKRH